MNAAGDFVVTWVESANGAPPSSSDYPGFPDPQVFYMQAFNASATPSGPATQLTLPSGQSPQGIPQVVADGTGDFDVAWLSTNSTFQTTLWLERFDAGGTAGSPVNVLGSSFSTPNPNQQQTFLGIAADAAGDLTLMWGVSGAIGAQPPVTGSINVQRFDANNNPIGGAIQVTASAAPVIPAIAEDAAGDFEIAWWQYVSGLYSLVVQPFNQQGSAIGGPVTIGTPSPFLDSGLNRRPAPWETSRPILQGTFWSRGSVCAHRKRRIFNQRNLWPITR